MNAEQLACKQIMVGNMVTGCTTLAQLYRDMGAVSMPLPFMRAAQGDRYNQEFALRHARETLSRMVP